MNAPVTGRASRERAHTILHEVLDRGRPLDEVLQTDRRLARLGERDRAFARNLVATTLRRLGQIDALIDDALDRPLPRSAAAARNALRLGICQILFLDTQSHAAVDTSVALAAARGPDRFKGVVNAILRRITRQSADALAARFPEEINLPAWLRESWAAAYGAEAARAIAEVCQAVPPVDISVREDAAGWAAKLGGTVIADGTVRLTRPGEISALSGFAEGGWWVQDAAAALPARLLIAALGAAAATEATTVCDLCAAPGGKTAQLAAAGLEVTAVDLSAARLATVRENLDRLGLAAALVEADATVWAPGLLYDGVLLDAPCTATGTIRRHPDIPHLKRPGDVARQSALQAKLLRAAADLVRPGGVLVYSVCSLQPEEGRNRIDAFLATVDNFHREPVSNAALPAFGACVTDRGEVMTLPCHMAESGGVDGFFIARLRRTAED